MKRQTSLDSYINRKTGSSLIASTPIMSEKKNKKKSRSLGYISKAEKVLSVKKEEIVVDLCSDDENTSHTEQPMVDCSNSQSSNSTIDYSFTPTTPNKYLKASPSSSSPKSAKFFSPKKNRAVFKRSPVKRNLTLRFYKETEVKNKVENARLNQACKDMDDKTIFLLTTIDKCINDDRLKALLDENIVTLLNQSFTVKKPGMRLVCRLYWRQDKWYRTDNLIDIINDKKQEIPYAIFTEILRCLVENRFIEPSGTSTMDFESLAKTLKVDEMQQLVRDLKLKPPSKSKQDMEMALKDYCKQKPITNFFRPGASNNTERVLHLMGLKVGVCYQLTAAARCALDKLYLLMYLGISYQTIREKKLELMLINDKSKLETYPVDKAMPLDSPTDIFANKQEFDRYWTAHIIHEAYIKQPDTAQKCSIVIKVFKLFKDVPDTDMMRYASLPPWLRRFTPPYLYARILTNGVEELKKDAAHHQLAVDVLTELLGQELFMQHKKGLWYAEKALILHKLLRQQEEAAAVLIEGLTSNLPEELKDAMRPRAKIVASRLNAPVTQARRQALLDCGVQTMILENSFPADHIAKHHMETATRGKRKFKVDTENQRMVMDAENYCLLEYTTNRDFTHGGHWEGRIVTTIYILLFWDIIYSKPPGVAGTFLSHYQLFPLDMKSGENFYENRKAAIEERLLEIKGMSTPELQQRMKYKWDERPECELSDIARHIEWGNVSMVVSCLGPGAVAALCRRLAANYGHAHSGFPDLTLWNVHTGKIKFVEVKTDSDKPSVKQLQWMRYLRDHDIDVGFCYLGAASTRNRARAAPSDVPT